MSRKCLKGSISFENLESFSIFVKNGKSYVFNTSSSSLWENRIGKALFHDTKTKKYLRHMLIFMVALEIAVQCVSERAFDYQGVLTTNVFSLSSLLY